MSEYTGAAMDRAKIVTRGEGVVEHERGIVALPRLADFGLKCDATQHEQNICTVQAGRSEEILTPGPS